MGYWCPKCHNIFDDKFDKELKQCKRCSSFDIVYMPDSLSMTMGELFVITKISTDKDFCQAMINLKEKDPIDYQVKLSQFKTQVEQQKQISNEPHCPHCNSTNIKPISGLNRGASIAMWGIFSKKINKSFECKNCGYTW